VLVAPLFLDRVRAHLDAFEPPLVCTSSDLNHASCNKRALTSVCPSGRCMLSEIKRRHQQIKIENQLMNSLPIQFQMQTACHPGTSTTGPAKNCNPLVRDSAKTTNKLRVHILSHSHSAAEMKIPNDTPHTNAQQVGCEYTKNRIGSGPMCPPARAKHQSKTPIPVT